MRQDTSLNANLSRQKHIHVGLQIEGALPKLSLDEWKVAQVLNNLISNAVKYSQPGTAVEVRAVAEDGGVRISVRDQGPGIPEAECGKLFQPFGRTSVRSTAGESSTGLGLTISRKSWKHTGGACGWKAGSAWARCFSSSFRHPVETSGRGGATTNLPAKRFFGSQFGFCAARPV